MTGPFSAAAALAFAATLAGLSGIGLVAGRFLAPSEPLPRFITDTFEFTLAPAWECDLEETEYVCSKGKPPHEAIAIIAMKRRGKGDNLADYKDYLSRPKTDQDGTPSTIRSVTRRPLAGYEWIEAVHVSSEIRNYITIYLATVTSQVGVLATFWVHPDHEETVRREMDRMMSSYLTSTGIVTILPCPRFYEGAFPTITGIIALAGRRIDAADAHTIRFPYENADPVRAAFLRTLARPLYQSTSDDRP